MVTTAEKRKISFKRIKRSRGSLSIIQRTKGISSLSRGLKNLPKGPLKLLNKSVKKYGKKAAKKIAKMLLKKPGEEGFEQLGERDRGNCNGCGGNKGGLQGNLLGQLEEKATIGQLEEKATMERKKQNRTNANMNKHF